MTTTTPAETSFPKSQIRVLLLENVHPSAHEVFQAEGFQVEACAGALGEDDLAEAVGMQVLFHDVVPKLPIGNNRRAESLEDLLARADFVTLHVPDTSLTRGLIGERELARMKHGGYICASCSADVYS